MEYQQELATKEAQLTKRILDRMRDILQRIGRADGYTIIVEANEGGVIWAQPSLDLTDRLVTEYNSGGGAGAGGDDD
jgi:outer membrane protein